MPNDYQNKPNDVYWASLPRDEIGTQLARQIDSYWEYAETSGRMYIWRESHYAYNEALGTGVDVNRAGPSGELSDLRLNEIRNLQTHMVNLTLAQRPAWQPRAINSDYKSQSQALLARGILDYEMSERELEKRFRTACNYAMTYGDSAIVAMWDAKSGEEATRLVQGIDGEEVSEVIYDENGDPIRTGEITYRAIPSFDVIRDVNASGIQNQDWYIIRDYVNRYDLISKYANVEEVRPEDFETEDDYLEVLNAVEQTRDAILGASAKNEMDPEISIGVIEHTGFDTELIPVYYFFHKSTPAIPEGRFTVSVCDGDVVLEDGPLPYEEVPVYFIYPGETYNQPFGYSPIFDVLAPAKVLNATMSTIVTNQRAFGVQNILVPQGSNISAPSLVGGLNMIPYVPDDQGGRPEVLNLLNTPPEVFEFATRIQQAMETLVGVNSVVRGNPESNLKSGSALALMAAQALQFSQEFQQSYIHCLEKVGTSVVNMYKTYAKTPRTVAIVGKAKQHYLDQFTRDDISYIDRVAVDVGSPLAKTTAGKLQVAENLIQMGAIKTPEQYLQVLQTGQLDSMMQGETAELMQIQMENEELQEGNFVQAIVTDNHIVHIQEHKAVLASPDSRKDPEILEAALNHIQEHIAMLQDPNLNALNALLGQPQVPSDVPQTSPLQVTQGGAESISQAVDVANNQNPIQGVAGDVQPANMPNLPDNPMTGEQYNLQDGGNPANQAR